MVAFEMPDFSISTHAPRTGSDLTCWRSFSPTSRFQPTLPARGATEPAGRKQTSSSYFNPRSPHGERRQKEQRQKEQRHFNPRSPHGERHAYKRSNQLRQHFNPRSPHGERPWFRGLHPPRFPISTHAPRTGSDFKAENLSSDTHGFQPTLPARGATTSSAVLPCIAPNFNPRSPHGERRLQVPRHRRRDISTHAPRTGSDPPAACRCQTPPISTHAPRTGSDTHTSGVR